VPHGALAGPRSTLLASGAPGMPFDGFPVFLGPVVTLS
jgi:hypothetical protein